jgi:predicted phage baseplate assembly protein
VFALGEAPVVAGATHLRLDNGAGDVQVDWREVPDRDRSGPHAREYLLNPERGEIESGDGLRGDVLPAGYTVFASYRAGGGVGGNIAEDTLSTVPANAANVALAPVLTGLGQPLGVFQPFAATGGMARETLRSALARAFVVVHEVDKAVTAADCERLALATPGVPVGRVHAVPGMYPALPCYPAPGVVALIVVPRCPRPAPMPSRALLDAVARYLEPRRLVTSELRVIPPCYRRVAVQATLNLDCDVDADALLALAIATIDAFFDPLTGGPDGSGWPIGRTVYRSEVMALLADVPGVIRVTDFGLRERGDDSPRCDNVELCPFELVVPGRHRIAVSTFLPRNLTRSDAHECQPC